MLKKAIFVSVVMYFLVWQMIFFFALFAQKKMIFQFSLKVKEKIFSRNASFTSCISGIPFTHKTKHEKETYFFIVISFCFLVKKIFICCLTKSWRRKDTNKFLLLFRFFSSFLIFCSSFNIFGLSLLFTALFLFTVGFCFSFYLFFYFFNESHFDLLLSPLFSGTGTYFLVWVMVMNKFCDFRDLSVRRTNEINYVLTQRYINIEKHKRWPWKIHIEHREKCKKAYSIIVYLPKCILIENEEEYTNTKVKY